MTIRFEIDQSNSILGRILEINGYRPVKLNRMPAGYLCVTAKIRDLSVSLILDTGSPGTCLDRNRTKHLGLNWRNDDTPGLDFVPPSVTHLRTLWYCYLPTMQVGPLKADGFCE